MSNQDNCLNEPPLCWQALQVCLDAVRSGRNRELLRRITMAANMDQDQLQSTIEEKSLQITTQGGAVRELKDRVKAKKKAKVCPRAERGCLSHWSQKRKQWHHRCMPQPTSVFISVFMLVIVIVHVTCELVCLQEDTSEADADVLAGVEKLKALKVELEALEEQLEKVTGIPRDKGAFREAVVRQPVPRTARRGCGQPVCVSSPCTPSESGVFMCAGKGPRRTYVLHAVVLNLWWRQWTV